MKKSIVLLIIFAPLWIVAQATKVNFETSLEQAFTKAKQTNKLVFIEYFNHTCTVCKSIEPFFDNADMASFYNEHFINYKMDTFEGLKDADKEFMDKANLHFNAVPFFLFFDKNQKFVHYSGARADLEYLLQIGKTALLPQERTESLQSKYESGDRSIKTLYAYNDLLQLYQKEAEINAVSDELFKVYPKANLGTHQSFLILKNAVFTMENGFFKYWLENKDKLIGMDKGNAKGEELKILENIVLTSLRSPEKMQWSSDKIAAAKKNILDLGIADDPDSFLWEAECAAWVRENKTQLAVEKMNKMLQDNENNTIYTITILETMQQIFKDKAQWTLIKTTLEGLKKKTSEPEQIGDIMVLETKHYKLIQDQVHYRRLLQETKHYLEKHQLDISVLQGI